MYTTVIYCMSVVNLNGAEIIEMINNWQFCVSQCCNSVGLVDRKNIWPLKRAANQRMLFSVTGGGTKLLENGF